MQRFPVKPAFDELSPDLQWAISQRRERFELSIQVGAIWLIALFAAPIVLPALNQQMDISLHEGREIKVFGITVYQSEPALEQWGVIPLEALRPVQKGDTIAGFPVTSGYGLRRSPCPGCSSDHRGIDLGTPTGTPLYAPAAKSSRVKVSCWTDTGGGGLVADISSPDIPDIQFQALHLSNCATGLHPSGSIIAMTGNTGNGTGPHLDWRQWDKATNEYQHPQLGYLQWVLTGQRPQPLKAYTSPQTAKELVQSFEGFHPAPYWDYQQWSSGYGTPAQSPDEEIDLATAEQRLQAYLDQAAQQVDLLVTVPLSLNQRDALISFQYNTGGLADSTLLEKLNAGDYQGAANEFERWIYVQSNDSSTESLGLIKRRSIEKGLFLKP
ncbi:MAG: glycoside hydrolase family protein [Leptolyngbyaceae cyanobacterium]